MHTRNVIGADSHQPGSAGEGLSRIAGSLGLAGPLRCLMLVEDPGAANFAAGLVSALGTGAICELFANEHGGRQLRRLGLACTLLGPDDDCRQMLERIQPQLLIVGTSEDPQTRVQEILRLSRQSNTPTIAFVDGPANVAARFASRASGQRKELPDWVLVPAAAAKAELVEAGFSAERVLIVVHPHLAALSLERARLEKIGQPALRSRLFPECDPHRACVVFLAERSDGLDASGYRRNGEYTLCGRGADDRRTNIVLEELLDALAGVAPRPYVVLRLHPKNEAGEFSAYAKEIDQVSRAEPALEVVYAADLVVGLTTVLLSEAAALGRRVLSVVPRPVERGWLLEGSGWTVPCVYRRHDLVRSIQTALDRDHRETGFAC